MYQPLISLVIKLISAHAVSIAFQHTIFQSLQQVCLQDKNHHNEGIYLLSRCCYEGLMLKF